MTLQEAKEKIVERINAELTGNGGYRDWRDMENYLINNNCTYVLLSRIDQAAELYANSKWNAAIEAAAEAASMKQLYMHDGSDQLTHSMAVVDKESILKLKV
jgi:hypothetical protein